MPPSTLTLSATPLPGRFAEAPAATRYRCDLAACCRPVAAWLARDRNCPATINDLSTGGLGLVLGRRFEAGAGLAVELPDASTQVNETLLVKVVQVEAQPGGRWLLRCAFITELSEDRILALVGPDAVPHSRGAGERGRGEAVWRRCPRLHEFFCRDRLADPRLRLGALLVGMLGLGASVSALVRLLR